MVGGSARVKLSHSNPVPVLLLLGPVFSSHTDLTAEEHDLQLPLPAVALMEAMLHFPVFLAA